MDVPSLPQPQRLILAELSGVARRYGTDGMRDAPRDVAIAAVQAVTEDPVLLGVQAGVALVDPHGINGRGTPPAPVPRPAARRVPCRPLRATHGPA